MKFSYWFLYLQFNESNKNLNPTPESVATLRGKFHGGAGLEKRYVHIKLRKNYGS